MLFPVAVSTNMKCKVLNCQCNCSGDTVITQICFLEKPIFCKTKCI